MFNAEFLRRKFTAVLAASLVIALPAHADAGKRFTIAVISDTQNYADHNRQRAKGYPIDAAELLYDQLNAIERRLVSNGGDVAFVTAVGDMWQSPTEPLDPDHVDSGLRIKYVTERKTAFDPAADFEIPTVVRAFKALEGKTPFSVVPGNHDYDSQYVLEAPTLRVHVGGLRKFTAAFGDQSSFFRDRDWYIASFNDGANSAQVFEGGGYRFLHVGLEMEPADDVLDWANGVVKAHPSLPVIVTVHDYLNPQGERKPIPELSLKDDHPGKPPVHNNAEDIWQKFIRPNAGIFMVLSGHQGGQAMRVDKNAAGYSVYQILTDYQVRHQLVDSVKPLKPGQGSTGDGWMRFMTFDFNKPIPTMHARTYSTVYKAYSVDIPKYAEWYKPDDHPEKSDEDYLALDDFEIVLDDFRTRFGNGK